MTEAVSSKKQMCSTGRNLWRRMLGHFSYFRKFAASNTNSTDKQINMKNICDYDQGCNEVIQNTMHEYFKGNVTKEEALNNFYRNLGERYPELAQ